VSLGATLFMGLSWAAVLGLAGWTLWRLWRARREDR
jgi:hypothetical protein